MTLHPKERGATRRDFLIRSGGAALGLSGAGSLLAACGNSTTPTASTNSQGKPAGPGGLPLARPDNPVRLPLWEDPIKSGLKPETGGTFTVYNYPAYLYKKLLNEFCAKYDVTPQYTPFDNIATGIQKLADGTVQPDVMEMTPDHSSRTSGRSSWTRSTTRAASTPSPTRSMRPASSGAPITSKRTSPV